MKTAKLDEQMKRSIIDKRCAETALIEAKTKLVMLEVEKAQKSDKAPTELVPTVNCEQLNAVLIEANKDLMEENAQITRKFDAKSLKFDDMVLESIVREQQIEDMNAVIDELEYRIKVNRFWFISIAGILSGILLFMILNYAH